MGLKRKKAIFIEIIIVNVVCSPLSFLLYRSYENYNHSTQGAVKVFLLMHILMMSVIIPLLVALKREMLHFYKLGIPCFDQLDKDIKQVRTGEKSHNNAIQVINYYYTQNNTQSFEIKNLDLIDLYRRRSYLEKMIGLGDDYYTCFTAIIISLFTGIYCAVEEGSNVFLIPFTVLIVIIFFLAVYLRFYDRGVLGSYTVFDYKYELEKLDEIIKECVSKIESDINEYIKIKAIIIYELKQKQKSYFIFNSKRQHIKSMINQVAELNTAGSQIDNMKTCSFKLISGNTIELPLNNSNDVFIDKYSLEPIATMLYEVLVCAEILC